MQDVQLYEFKTGTGHDVFDQGFRSACRNCDGLQLAELLPQETVLSGLVHPAGELLQQQQQEKGITKTSNTIL